MNQKRLEAVLGRLEVRRPAPTLAGLSELYSAWCRNVSFDNVRKRVHIASGDPGPLPGDTPEDFFDGFLRYNTGGTCWPGAGALHALVSVLGFEAQRGVATMLVGPTEVPPNHGTVVVDLDEGRFLIDASILHVEPLPLIEGEETGVDHPARGVRCGQLDDRFVVTWRSPIQEDVRCRVEWLGASANDYRELHEGTRGWSPFNFGMSMRRIVGQGVEGFWFGKATAIENDGTCRVWDVDSSERNERLAKLGVSGELIGRLADDEEMPPPPGSGAGGS